MPPLQRNHRGQGVDRDVVIAAVGAAEEPKLLVPTRYLPNRWGLRLPSGNLFLGLSCANRHLLHQSRLFEKKMRKLRRPKASFPK